MGIRDAFRLSNKPDALRLATTPATPKDVVTNVRDVKSGSSLVATGLLPPPDYDEKGSATGITVRDVIPELANRQQAIRTYDQMVNNDVTVDVSLRTAKAPVMGATYFVEPYSDNQDDIDIAEFVEYNLMHGMTTPFLIVLEEIMRMLEYGFSILEPVWELGEWAPKRKGGNTRQATMLRKLAPRPASTITQFFYDDNGGPVGVEQNAIDKDNKAKKITIDIEKLIIFTFNKKGGNLEGRSILRTSRKPWYYKEQLYKIDAIQKERHALGVPTMTMPPNASSKDYDTAWEMVRNIRANEEGGAVLPPGFIFEFAKMGNSQPVDVMKSIEHHDGRIMLNTLTQFMLLGMTSGGGRATSGSHVDMFQKAYKYMANYISEAFNMYLIPNMVAYNFPTKNFPKLKTRNVGEGKDLQMLASALANLAAQNLITLDLDTEQWVREQFDVPFKLGSVQTPEANAAGGNGPTKGNPGAQSGNPNNGTGNKNTTPGAEAVS